MDKQLKKKVIKDLEDIQKVFDKFGVDLYITYGVVLGFHRDKDFLPEDDDVDLTVIADIDFRTRKKIGWMLTDLGFRPQPILFNVFGRMEPAEEGYNGDAESGIIVCERNFKFTIFFKKEVPCETHGVEYLCVPKLGAKKLIAVPKKFFETKKTIKIGGKKYLVPSPIKDYLSFCYADWKDKTLRDHSPTFYEAHNEDMNKEDIL